MPVSQKAAITEDILRFTDVHPYYTQQLAAAVYNAIEYGEITENVVAYAIKRQVEEHSTHQHIVRFYQALAKTGVCD